MLLSCTMVVMRFVQSSPFHPKHPHTLRATPRNASHSHRLLPLNLIFHFWIVQTSGWMFPNAKCICQRRFSRMQNAYIMHLLFYNSWCFKGSKTHKADLHKLHKTKWGPYRITLSSKEKKSGGYSRRMSPDWKFGVYNDAFFIFFFHHCLHDAYHWVNLWTDTYLVCFKCRNNTAEHHFSRPFFVKPGVKPPKISKSIHPKNLHWKECTAPGAKGGSMWNVCLPPYWHSTTSKCTSISNLRLSTSQNSFDLTIAPVLWFVVWLNVRVWYSRNANWYLNM